MGMYHSKEGKSFVKEAELKQLLNAPLKGFVPSGSSKDDLEYMTEKYPNPNMDAIRGYIGNLANENPKDKRLWELKEKYIEDDRDKISKTDLFTVLTYKIDEISTEARREKSFKADAKHSSKKFMEVFSLEDQYSTYELDQLVESHIKSKKLTFTKDDMKAVKKSMKAARLGAIEEVENRDRVGSDETIYVTSPRGGHEFLSIYSYANKLDKGNIPSDILHTGERTFNHNYPKLEKHNSPMGLTYIGNRSGKVKRVVVLDDVVGSGQQKQEFYNILRTKFPDAQLYYNTLSLRKKDLQTYPLNFRDIREKKLYSTRGFSAVTCADETVGIKGYRNGIAGNVGSVFPWAIPDGASDRISRLLVQAKDDKMRNIGTRRYKVNKS